MNSIIKFFHQLWNPHCPNCALELQESKFCNSCETMREQISQLNSQNLILLNRLVNPTPVTVVDKEEKVQPPLKTSQFIPYAVRRQMLEEQDRNEARILRENESKLDTNSKEQKEIEELEKKVGL